MKVALIGASGFVGSAILKELKERRHEVTGIVRDPSKIIPQTNVLAVQADVNDTNALSAVIKGHDAVISAFSAGWTNPNLYDDFKRGARSILEAVKESGVKRFIVIGGAGSLYVDENIQLVNTPDFPQDFKPGALAAAEYLKFVELENGLDWTFFSPAIEMNADTSGIRTGKYRTGLDNPVFDNKGRSSLSVEDLAVAIVDELENGQFIQKRFTAAY
ncbi:NAD(P)-dependent oxidoreductase [Sphingobacterium olei]|uniref:NAD(P)-dependent oxidoreductase n=1 Tax=Sphingobacterium olei TaxID=2571155 RepID=A0A4U0P7S5_9SPHI|nr:NAD(P)-dependent oxidoreductase [Sphingobacterium olei]TJZ63439.1 NAD(P)-dependent oxidoreductase [Sphingobacterium olei]